MKNDLLAWFSFPLLLSALLFLPFAQGCGGGKSGPKGPVRAAPAGKTALPVLLDLGADKCIPCKKMFPVLEALKKECPGRVEVKFIDVWKNPAEAEKYKVRVIPTQIFLDPSGRELFRHVGFFPKEKILAKFKELGW